MPEEDWRLFHVDESMQGALFHLREWEPPTPDWDHEHCSLCWADIAEGYVMESDDPAPPRPVEERTSHGDGVRFVEAPTDDFWICPNCFGEFRERFGWQTA